MSAASGFSSLEAPLPTGNPETGRGEKSKFDWILTKFVKRKDKIKPSQRTVAFIEAEENHEEADNQDYFSAKIISKLCPVETLGMCDFIV